MKGVPCGMFGGGDVKGEPVDWPVMLRAKGLVDCGLIGVDVGGELDWNGIEAPVAWGNMDFRNGFES